MTGLVIANNKVQYMGENILPFKVTSSSNSKKPFAVLSAPFRFIKEKFLHVFKEDNRKSIIHVKLVGDNGKISDEMKVIAKTNEIRKQVSLLNMKEEVPLIGNSRFILEITPKRLADIQSRNRENGESQKQKDFKTVTEIMAASTGESMPLPESNAQFVKMVGYFIKHQKTGESFDPSVPVSQINKMRASLSDKTDDQLKIMASRFRANIEEQNPKVDLNVQEEFLSLVEIELERRSLTE